MIKMYILMHLLMLFYSFAPAFSKLAGRHPFFSLRFLLYYGIVLLILFVYSILWKQLLKKVSLLNAYANKAVTIIWSMLWGCIFFQEIITGMKLLGVGLIAIGVFLYAGSGDTGDATEEGSAQ